MRQDTLGCSRALWLRLTLGDDSSREIAAIQRDGDLHAELVRLAPQIIQDGLPAGPEGVFAVLAPLTTVYRLAERSEGEWAAFWGEYYDALQELPRRALQAAKVAYNKKPPTRDWTPGFPTPPEIHALALEEARKLRLATFRCHQAASREAKALPTPQTDEEREARRLEQAEIARGMAELKGRLGSRQVNFEARRVAPAAPVKTPQERAAEIRAMEPRPDGEDEAGGIFG